MNMNILEKIKKDSINNLCGNNSFQFRLDLNYEDIINYLDKLSSLNLGDINEFIIKKLSTNKFFNKYKIIFQKENNLQNNKSNEKEITIFDDCRVLITNCNDKKIMLLLIEKIFQNFS